MDSLTKAPPRAELKPCPWCGSAPDVESKYDRFNQWGATYIRCSCPMKPLASGYCNIGYYDRINEFHRTCSEEKAVEESADQAARRWNKRAPVKDTSAPSGTEGGEHA